MSSPGKLVQQTTTTQLNDKLKNTPQSLSIDEVLAIVKNETLRNQLNTHNIITIAEISKKHAVVLVSHEEVCAKLEAHEVVQLADRHRFFSSGVLLEMLKHEELRKILKTAPANIVTIAKQYPNNLEELIKYPDLLERLTADEIWQVVKQYTCFPELLHKLISNLPFRWESQLDPAKKVLLAQILREVDNRWGHYTHDEYIEKLTREQLVEIAQSNRYFAQRIVTNPDLFDELQGVDVVAIAQQNSDFRQFVLLENPDLSIPLFIHYKHHIVDTKPKFNWSNFGDLDGPVINLKKRKLKTAPERLEIWVEGAKTLIREQQNKSLRLEKARELLKQLDITYKEKLNTAPSSEVTTIKTRARIAMVDIINNSALNLNQRLQLRDEVLQNGNSSIRHRRYLTFLSGSNTEVQFSRGITVNDEQPDEVSKKIGFEIESTDSSLPSPQNT